MNALKDWYEKTFGKLVPAQPIKFHYREAEIMEMIGEEGISNKEIAIRLRLTEATIKVYVNRIMKKLKVVNRTQIAIYYLKERM